MDEMYHHHHQHTSSTSHHKIERTSIRTYYSNLDLSQSSSNQASSHARQAAGQPMQQLIVRPPVAANYRQMQRQHSQDYMNQVERYIDDLDVDADAEFEDDEMLYKRNRRGSYAPGMSERQLQQLQAPTGRYPELVTTSLQTAKGRMQHPQQQPQRLRSPSLPTIRQREYVRRHQEQQQQQQKGAKQLGQVNGNVKGTNTDPSNGNMPHRFNNPNASQAPAGCQEEDTSGYLSDTPKNTHTPDIWYNDAASQNGSISGMGSASQAEGSVVSAAAGNVRRLRRSIQGAPIPMPMPLPMPIPTPTLTPTVVPQASKPYAIKGRCVPAQRPSYEPQAADGYLADG